ncbi:aspartate aminotransferase family protein [Labilibaculum euxinus]|uniref:Aminotransferase class III-fold pyridoxal phosphate-dependent enzyme n=1 Tax=Labilibaculum euxinus TaxID=2686357 RepID=A0A7M4D4L6_9BACT|nr:aminotransferase class III-fold pyridoxal phosphate-dependent enzyme [Labilibaculum euxinus]MUP37595.1 aminotransferase class III-fold pyridoxal phosphate-dependent enzyme [Labilibaculum euxinus]MVB06800.1 aminotransferase class III-fold pyridoxal phosphate-dependent enzyme [Labilibaculum euxinus]
MELFNVYNCYDINLVNGKGSNISDDKGNKYLDFYGGHGVISIGHSHPHYIFRMEHQLHCLGFYSNAVRNDMQEKLANKLGTLSGYDDYNLFLCNSGAEANENALKVASFHTGKSKIVAIKGAFHGRSSGVLAITDNPALSSEFNVKHDVVFIEMNDIPALEKALGENDVAAVIIEGIQGVNGVVEPSVDFLKSAESLCKAHKAMLILDEIQSGYGRTGKFFAHQHAGIKADIITTAKGMGNGFPIAGVIISPAIKAWSGMLGTTFGGNHLACAAGMAVLEAIEEEQLIDNANRLGDYLISELKDNKAIKAIRGRGLMIGIDLEDMPKIRKQLLEEYGIFTGSSGSTTLRLLPPLSITKKEVDQFIQAFQKLTQIVLT